MDASQIGKRAWSYARHDSLAATWNSELSMVLANPPFGKGNRLSLHSTVKAPDTAPARVAAL